MRQQHLSRERVLRLIGPLVVGFFWALVALSFVGTRGAP